MAAPWGWQSADFTAHAYKKLENGGAGMSFQWGNSARGQPLRVGLSRELLRQGTNCLKIQHLKGQFHEIFDPFKKKKNHMGVIWTGKNDLANFFVFAKIFAKIREKTCVRVVVDYADTTMTTWTLSENLWVLLTDIKGTIRQNKAIWVCLHTQ